MLEEFILYGAASFAISGFLRAYSEKIKRDRHVLDKEKIRRLIKENTLVVPNVRKKYEDKVNELVNGLKESLPNINIPYLKENLFDYKIVELIKSTENSNMRGSYIVKYNIIKINNEFIEGLSHELLHLSSGFQTNEYERSGFYIYNKATEKSIGEGFNEGYTALLDERIFNHGGYYLFYSKCSQIVELIVGEDKMTQMYFNADLDGIIRELERYSSYDETVEFIKSLDNVLEEVRKNENYNNFTELMKFANMYLFKCYCNFLRSKIDNNTITINDGKRLLTQFLSLAIITLEDENGNEVYSTPEDETEEIILTYFFKKDVSNDKKI